MEAFPLKNTIWLISQLSACSTCCREEAHTAVVAAPGAEPLQLAFILRRAAAGACYVKLMEMLRWPAGANNKQAPLVRTQPCLSVQAS